MKGRHREENKIYAIKIIEKRQTEREIKRVAREMKILQNIYV